MCATFEVSGDPNRWIQFMPGVINLAYPHTDDPSPLPAQLGLPPALLLLVEWEPGAFATFNIETPLTVREIAQTIDALFESTLGCAGRDYSVDVELFDLPPD